MSWQSVRGHDHLIAAFYRAVRRGRLAHGYLFVGPPGVGKRLFAGELAKALLCEGPGERFVATGGCGTCDACRLVEAGTHPDLFVVARPVDSQSMPIDSMRELSRSLSLKPARGHGKIAIIDDADDLNDPLTGHAAANCFLKTLEEPSPHSLLILVGTSADLQLPTIVSRCQVVRFTPLPSSLVGELLRTQGVEDAELVERLARFSQGCPGQARALADPALWEFRHRLLEGLAQPQVDSVALARAWTRFVEEAGKESAAQRRRAGLVVQLLLDFVKQAVAISIGGQPRFAEARDEQPLQALARRADAEQLLEIMDRCLEADVQIDRRVQLSLLLEALMDALGQKSRTWNVA